MIVEIVLTQKPNIRLPKINKYRNKSKSFQNVSVLHFMTMSFREKFESTIVAKVKLKAQ